MATTSAGGLPELLNAVHSHDVAEADLLNEQLSDAFTPADADCFLRVKVDQVDLDLPRYPASMVPGALTIDNPFFTASPLRG